MLNRIFNRKWITPIYQLTINTDRCKLMPMLWTGLRNYQANDSSTALNKSLAIVSDTRPSRPDFRNRSEQQKVDPSDAASNENKPVWAYYKRNHKGMIPPEKTRLRCQRKGKMASNPCPVCRQKDGTLHYTNVKFLIQFISPDTGKIVEPSQTGVCRLSHKRLVKAIEKSRNLGLLPTPIPLDIPIPNADNYRHSYL